MTSRTALRWLQSSGWLMFCLGLASFTPRPLQAQTGAAYFVSSTGSDSNPGTFAEPWLTIQHAADTATAGATVYVLGGVCPLL
ncbi:MAG: hypothetical protein ABSF46_27415 [Terriglobia bacterium]|jgi:hypothetical protein